MDTVTATPEEQAPAPVKEEGVPAPTGFFPWLKGMMNHRSLWVIGGLIVAGLGVFGYLLAAIAVISLVVGGIGGGLSTSVIAGWRVIFTAAPIIVAFSCVFLTGILFGYLPARKAAHLDPIDALARN